MKYVKIVKLEKLPGGETSNYATIGDPIYGHVIEEPEVGKRFNVYPLGIYHPVKGINTSGVTEILSENLFKTQHSLYQWEYLDEIPNY